MKKVQKVLTLLLVFMMVFTTAGMNVAAAGEMDSVAGEADIQSQEQPQTLDETDTQQETTQQPLEGILEYVYVDEAVVNMPQTQNIAVGFSDESLVLESAVLHYSSVVTGEQFEMPASAIVNNTVLFTQDYPEGSAEDVYQLDSLTYQSSGVSSTVNLLDEEIDAGYTVTVQPEEENSSEEAVPDVAVYSLSEDGNVIEASSDTENIEETVAGVLEEADPVSPLAREARANKTVVICAGHDATHTGASGNGLKEEELTFKVAQYCKQALEQYQGVTVYMDRDSISCKYPGQNTSYCLNQRIKDAAALGATVFVDIHFNTGGGTGAEVYYPNKSYNEGIHQEGQNLANKILSELSALGLTNRGAKIKDGTTGETDPNGNKDDYFTTNYLSKQYGMTGVIVEHAFLDSASDAAKLKDENFLKKLGEADAAGIAATYGFSKGNNGNEQATVQIKNKNDFNGTAQIEVSGVGAGAQIAVWSDDNGQDDLKWYSVSGNSGTVNFDIKNHKKSAGTYNVHVYNSSSTKILCNTTFRVSKDTSAKLKVSAVDGRQDLYRVKLSFADMPDEVSGVQFPVWSKGDQSDIRWITAQKTSSGVWEADVSISGYQIGDIYQVHAYASLTNGKQVFIGNSTFKVVGPSADVTIKNYSAENGTFDVVVENIVAPAGVKEVQVPVWSLRNQSDIVWYRAEKQSDGTYKVGVDIANHKNNTGTYNIHIYILGNDGSQTMVASTTQKVETSAVEITAKDETGKESQYELTAKNVRNADQVRFAVWSDVNGQDDLIWYDAKKKSSTWSTEISIANHKTAGVYNVHVYSTVGKKQTLIGNTTFKVSSPTGTLEVKNYSESKGSFEVILKNVTSKSGVNAVYIPVWSKANQSDIVWYQADKQSDGSYKVIVKTKNHNQNTIYNIHAYVTAKNGIMQFVDGTSKDVSKMEPKVSISNADGKEKKYTATIENANALGKVSSVQVAVWSDTNGQDDWIWYQGTQKNADAWSTEIEISNHKTAGSYNVHVYGMIDGVQKFLVADTFEVSKPKGTIEVKNYNAAKGTFDVVVKNVSSKSGVQEVQIPVWSKEDQSDIVWYSAEKQGDGTYKAEVELSRHQNNKGTYNIHVYILTETSIYAFVAGTTYEVSGNSSEQNTENLTPIMGESTTTVEQMMRYYESTGNQYPAEALGKGGAPTLRDFCQIYYDEATAEGVKAEVAFAQAMKESAWLKFGGIVKIEQFNFAGLGALDGNSQGQAASFPDVRTGIRAQIQHLKAYASSEALKNACVDPRFKYVTRNSAPYVEWLGIKENPSGTGWASSKNYGYQIVNMMDVLKNK